MLVVTLLLWSAVFHGGYVLSLDCEYSSREHQVVLHPDILTTSFKAGITRVLDELAKIEDDEIMDFKVSLSSLKFKNVSVTEYILPNTRDTIDMNVPLRFKSRQKKFAKDHASNIETKFELDIYAENGRVLPKTAQSFTIDLPMGFDRTSAINISKYLVDAASQFTRFGLPIIIVPDAIGLVTMQTAEFNIRVVGQQFEATIFLLQRSSGLQSEFSFKIKDKDIDRQILFAAQQLIPYLSRIPSIAQFAA